MVRLTPISSEVSTSVDDAGGPAGALSLIAVHAGRAKIVLALLKVRSAHFRLFISSTCEVGSPNL